MIENIELKNIDEVVYYYKSKNGLPIYMIINKNVKDYYLSLNVKYGSCDTEFKVNDKYFKVSNGLAHFLEHVNFNMDDETTANDYFKKYGSDINAYTTFDFTSYTVTNSTKIKDNIKLLIEYVFKSYFNERIVNKEKGIILEEVKMGKNNTGRKMFYGSNQGIYVNSKRRNYITGDIEDVEGITLKELELVHDNFYNVDNAFLVVTGNFKVKDVIDVVDSINLDNNSKIIEIIKEDETDKVNDKYIDCIDNNIKIPKLRISYKMSDKIYKDIDKEELEYYFRVILSSNFDETSLLSEELMEEGLISYMVYDYVNHDGVIVFSIDVETNYVDDVIYRVREKIKNLEVSEEDINRKRRVNIANLIKRYDDIEFVNTDIADQIVKYGRLYDNMYDIFNNINIKNIEDVINKMDISNEAIFVLRDGK